MLCSLRRVLDILKRLVYAFNYITIEVIERLNRDDVGIVVIGKGVLKERLKSQIATTKRRKQILYYERIPNNELGSIYSRANLFLLPTNYEIYGMVVMEALENGVPVISTPEAGPAYILSEEMYGTCLKLDVEKWCKEIENRLLTPVTNDEKNNMRNYVNKKFRWQHIAVEYYNVLDKLLKGEPIKNSIAKKTEHAH